MAITKLPNVRLSFPDLFAARAFNATSEPKYGATFLVPKNSEAAKQMDKDVLEAATVKFGAKAAAVIKSIKGNANKYCIQDGDTLAEAKGYDGYKGMWAVKAGNKTRPTVVDLDKSPLTRDDGKPYSGCYVNASFEFFAYDNSGQGISASLRGVQFAKDGVAFSGGGVASVDEFEDISSGADASSLV